MAAKFVTLAKLNTLGICLSLGLSSFNVSAQGIRGPDTSGPAVGNVGTDAVLVDELNRIRGMCLGRIVDELIGTVSEGKIRVSNVSELATNNRREENKKTMGYATIYQVTANTGCNFFVTNRFDSDHGPMHAINSYVGIGIMIVADLKKCPNDFPQITNRTLQIGFPGGGKSDLYSGGSPATAFFNFQYKEVHKTDAFANIISTTRYAIKPHIIGGEAGDLEFSGLEFDTNFLPLTETAPVEQMTLQTDSDRVKVKTDPVFKYPGTKYRQCLETGLSSLAKNNP